MEKTSELMTTKKGEHKFEGARQTKGQETQFEIWEHAVWNTAVSGQAASYEVLIVL